MRGILYSLRRGGGRCEGGGRRVGRVGVARPEEEGVRV